MSDATRFTSCGNSENLRTFTSRVLADLTAIRTALVATTAKLDGDSGISETDYATNDPAALTTVALTAE